MSVLLMTGTIDSSYFGNVQTRISETEVRKKQYYDTLERYIKESNFSAIVFAENSGYPFDVAFFTQMALGGGKAFEYLFVPTDVELTKQKGKSYGEAHLIAEAVKRSLLIQKEGVFYKVTGRVYVENINALLNDKIQNEGICHNVYSSFFTVFFKMRVDIFNRCLFDAEDYCDERDGWKFIETIYYQHLSGEKIRHLKRYPRLSGQVGATGNPYNRSWANYLVKNVLLKIGYYDFEKRLPISLKQEESIIGFVKNLLKK